MFAGASFGAALSIVALGALGRHPAAAACFSPQGCSSLLARDAHSLWLMDVAARAAGIAVSAYSLRASAYSNTWPTAHAASELVFWMLGALWGDLAKSPTILPVTSLALAGLVLARWRLNVLALTMRRRSHWERTGSRTTGSVGSICCRNGSRSIGLPVS